MKIPVFGYLNLIGATACLGRSIVGRRLMQPSGLAPMLDSRCSTEP
jgi:hypothetical protein